MNRAIARRTLFEQDQDFRRFLALVAREVRRQRLEIHAYSLMPTHFHLLLRSPHGQLSEAMRLIQNQYSRWFNRSRRRDGPLYRGRFLSCEVDTLGYRRNVVTYIHDNAIEAGLASTAQDYRWSNAWSLCRRSPRWLTTDWIDQELERRGTGATRAGQLDTAFPTRVDLGFRAWVERNLRAGRPQDRRGGAVPYVGSPRVAQWMQRKAGLADGTRPFQAVSRPEVVEELMTAAQIANGPIVGVFARRSRDAWPSMRAGLLRALAGCSLREIGLRSGRTTSSCWRDVKDHAQLLGTNPAYEQLAAKLTAEVVLASR